MPFPETNRSLESETLLEVFVQAPARLSHALLDLGDEARLARPVPGKWSIQEIVLHLADAEIMGAARIRQVLATPGSLLAVYDQDRWAERFGYQAAGRSALDQALALFGLLRETTGSLLGSASAGEWGQSGEHPEWGEVTLRQLLELYADHGERHLEQILERRRMLGVPMPMDRLLPRRLY